MPIGGMSARVSTEKHKELSQFLKKYEGGRMREPAISVIVPIYNGRKHIRICMESLLGQSFKDYEIILVDDSSGDGSYELCQRLYGDRENVRIIQHEKNCGQAMARQTGLELAKGKYVAFADQDDLLLDDALETVYSEAEKHGAEVLHSIGRYLLFAGSKEPVPCVDDKEPSEGVLLLTEDMAHRVEGFCSKRYNGFLWNKLFLRKFIVEKGIGFGDVPLDDDWLFAFECLCHAKRYVIVPKLFYVYRITEDSTLRKPKAPKDVRMLVRTAVILPRLLDKAMAKVPFFGLHPEYAETVKAYFTDDPISLAGRWGMYTAPAEIRKAVSEEAEGEAASFFGGDGWLFAYLFAESAKRKEDVDGILKVKGENTLLKVRAENLEAALALGRICTLYTIT